MIITNSTPDKYYYDQLIAFLMSVKINSPRHMRLIKVFLANYPKDLETKLKTAFQEVEFENNRLKMIDRRGFGVIVDRAIRVRECFDKYKEPVVWMDTDILVRGDLSEFLEIKPRQLKILHRKGSPERVRINAGVFNIGCSKVTYNFICDWYDRIKSNKRWGQGQLEFWRAFQAYKGKIKMTDLTLKYNSAGKFDDSYTVWHCKKAHFKKKKYHFEYQKYLAVAERYVREMNMENANYAQINARITSKLLNTQNKSEREKIRVKRHVPIVNIVSKYANKDLPLLDIGAREGNLLKLLLKNGFKNLYGVDISEEAIAILKDRGFKGEVVDAQKFNLNKSFNTIILSHILEHCPDAKVVLNNAYKHLVEGGILYVEVPRQPKISMPTKAGHFHHYDELVEFLSLFDISKWQLLRVDYTRGENKGRIKSIFKKLKVK